MALSSESNKWNYDVLLSFRGEDTRNNFTSHLYNALCQKGVNTFIDYKELKRGEKILPSLLKAIEDSRILVIIISKTYASSTSCLDELLKILECKDSKGQVVLPVFYDVNPSQVRGHQGSFGEALAKHEDKFKDDLDKVKRWRDALCEVANLSGWHLGDGYVSNKRGVNTVQGTNNIEGIRLDLPESDQVEINGKAFSNMKMLRLLMISNAHVSDDIKYLSNELRLIDWPEYPSSTLPPNFHPKRLVSLNMSRSRIKHLWKGAKIFKDLKLVSFSCCEYLTEIPDFSMIPNIESLSLDHCKSLTKVHESVGYLDKLVTLNLLFCCNLRTLPSYFKLKSLHTLLLTGCSNLRKFPDIVEKMEHLEEIFLQGTAIKELPQSIEYLIGLKFLFLDSSKKLEHLPTNLHKFSQLMFTNCHKLINEQVQSRITNLLYNEESVSEVMLPGDKIPDWFHHQSTYTSIALEVASRLYGKPVELFFGAVFELDQGASSTGMFSCVYEVIINDHKTLVIERSFESLDSSHVWLTPIKSGPLMWLLNCMNYWNHFRISFGISEVSSKVKVKATLKSCGFHILCKQEGYVIDNTLVRKPIE
ncbi:hypothetical protein RIF29_06295 [Crotalaria pallida]|uniref:TIR domain-containing protein n=1 Tax=Crotalaria pallida TaxID=3830 RepID=A0AAN9J311_CROPI